MVRLFLTVLEGGSATKGGCKTGMATFPGGATFLVLPVACGAVWYAADGTAAGVLNCCESWISLNPGNKVSGEGGLVADGVPVGGFSREELLPEPVSSDLRRLARLSGFGICLDGALWGRYSY